MFDISYNSCVLQDINFSTLEEQIKNCPLIDISHINDGDIIYRQEAKNALWNNVDDISCGYYEVDGIRDEDIDKIIDAVPPVSDTLR